MVLFIILSFPVIWAVAGLLSIVGELLVSSVLYC